MIGPPHRDDTPEGEVIRILNDFRSEMRGVLSELVRRDVYVADKTMEDFRISALEERARAEELYRRTTRNISLGAFLSALLSLAILVLQNRLES